MEDLLPLAGLGLGLKSLRVFRKIVILEVFCFTKHLSHMPDCFAYTLRAVELINLDLPTVSSRLGYLLHPAEQIKVDFEGGTILNKVFLLNYKSSFHKIAGPIPQNNLINKFKPKCLNPIY